MKRIKFNSKEEMEQIKTDQIAAGLKLIETQRHVDGDFLIFGEPSEQEQIDELRKRVEVLEKI